LPAHGQRTGPAARAAVVFIRGTTIPDASLREFFEELSRINKGRACFASAERLGERLFADYIRNKQRTVW